MISKEFEKGYIIGYLLSAKDTGGLDINDEEIKEILKQIFASFNIILTDDDYKNAIDIHDKCEQYGKELMGGA